MFLSEDAIDIINILASCTPSYFLLKRYVFFCFLRGFKTIHIEGVSQQTLSPWHASDRDGLLPPGWGKSWVVSPYTTCHPQNRTQMPKVFSGMGENSQIIDKDCIIKNMGTFLQEMLTWRQTAIFLCSFLFCSGCYYDSAEETGTNWMPS